MDVKLQQGNNPRKSAAVKKQALTKVKNGISKTEIAAETGIARKTLYSWINQQNQQLETLKPEEKIKLWERESIRDMQLAAKARDMLQEMLDTDNKDVKPDTKVRIMYSASVTAGIKWDKSRLEAGQGISNDVHAVIINMYDRREPIVSPAIEIKGSGEIKGVTTQQIDEVIGNE